jgi:hypothetical protein
MNKKYTLATMPASKALVAPDVTSPAWGDEYSDVYDITNLNISHSEFISRDRPTDKYDYLGRNISAQERRQVLVPWVMSDPRAKRYKLVRPADTYDKFQISIPFDLAYVWSDRYKIYSTMSSY